MSDGQRVVIMGCAHSAGEALQALQDRGRELPANVEWVELTCGGMLDELYILRAFESGARGVMVLSCCDGACRSVDGSEWAGKRVQAVRDLLSEAGLPTEGLVYHTMAPSMAADLWGWIQDLSA
jgi:coenzyme F420-reducing hydrogenase delta subunit